jgi:GNAT superfamily N-acetyltransferase
MTFLSQPLTGHLTPMIALARKLRSSPIQPKQKILRDHTPVTVRPICSADMPRMVAFHKTLSDETVYSRYFGIRKLEVRTEPRHLQQICTDDPDKGLILVAGTNFDYPQEQILGIGELAKIGKTDEAEFAVLVTDDYQGQGLGTQLLKELIESAPKRGINRIRGHFLRQNYAMRNACRKLGFTIGYDPETGESMATINLFPAKEIRQLKNASTTFRRLAAWGGGRKTSSSLAEIKMELCPSGKIG